MHRRRLPRSRRRASHRRAPVRQRQRRSGERVLQRRDDRRADHGAHQGRGAARGLAHLGLRAQGRARGRPRARRAAQRERGARGVGAASRATGSGSPRSSPACATAGPSGRSATTASWPTSSPSRTRSRGPSSTRSASTLLQDLGDPTPVRYTANLKAYNLYLKGRYWWNRRTPGGASPRGSGTSRQAIAEDAGYALAYTGLADSYALQLDYRGAPVQRGARARPGGGAARARAGREAGRGPHLARLGDLHLRLGLAAGGRATSAAPSSSIRATPWRGSGTRGS